jgi:hypothetical protein
LLSPSSRSRRRHDGARFALILVGCIALSGCSTVSSWFSSSSATSKEPAVGACPTAAVLRPLAQTAVFAPGAARQPTGVAFYGILSEVEAKCDRAAGAVRASLDIVIIGERGPSAAGATDLDLQYFIAVTGPDQAILSKRTLPVHITIPANARRAGVTDHIEETIALGGRPAGELNIVVGFQQSPEIVEFYRNFRGR